MLKEKIKADYMSAFKAKNTVTKNLLSVIISEVQTIEKNIGVETLNDDEVIKIITKTVKSLKEQLVIDNPEITASVKEEINILENYLPKQMAKEEIIIKIKELIDNGVSNIGDVMKAFASLPVDRKEVSMLYNELK